jgi:hypothetical protein
MDVTAARNSDRVVAGLTGNEAVAPIFAIPRATERWLGLGAFARYGLDTAGKGFDGLAAAPLASLAHGLAKVSVLQQMSGALPSGLVLPGK